MLYLDLATTVHSLFKDFYTFLTFSCYWEITFPMISSSVSFSSVPKHLLWNTTTHRAQEFSSEGAVYQMILLSLCIECNTFSSRRCMLTRWRTLSVGVDLRHIVNSVNVSLRTATTCFLFYFLQFAVVADVFVLQVRARFSLTSAGVGWCSIVASLAIWYLSSCLLLCCAGEIYGLSLGRDSLAAGSEGALGLCLIGVWSFPRRFCIGGTRGRWVLSS